MRHENRLSLRDVEIRSGGAISKGYVGQIENRSVLGHSVTPQKLSALAKGLGVSADELFAVARGKSLASETQDGAQRIVGFYNEMSPTARHHLELISETLWRDSQRQIDDGEKESASPDEGAPRKAKMPVFEMAVSQPRKAAKKEGKRNNK